MTEEFEGLTPERKAAIDKRREEIVEQFGPVLGWWIDNDAVTFPDDCEAEFNYDNDAQQYHIGEHEAVMLILRSGRVYTIDEPVVQAVGGWITPEGGWQSIEARTYHNEEDGCYKGESIAEFPNITWAALDAIQIRADEIECAIALKKLPKKENKDQ